MARQFFKRLEEMFWSLLDAVAGHTGSQELAAANGRELPVLTAGEMPPVKSPANDPRIEAVRRLFEEQLAGQTWFLEYPEAALFDIACRAAGLERRQRTVMHFRRLHFNRVNKARQQASAEREIV